MLLIKWNCPHTIIWHLFITHFPNKRKKLYLQQVCLYSCADCEVEEACVCPRPVASRSRVLLLQCHAPRQYPAEVWATRKQGKLRTLSGIFFIIHLAEEDEERHTPLCKIYYTVFSAWGLVTPSDKWLRDVFWKKYIWKGHREGYSGLNMWKAKERVGSVDDGRGNGDTPNSHKPNKGSYGDLFSILEIQIANQVSQ